MGQLIKIVMILAAIVVAGLVIHLKSIGTSNVIVGATSDEISFPPKKVFWKYAELIEDFKTTASELHPLHFTFNRCLTSVPFEPDCIRMFDLILEKTGGINSSSGTTYQLTPLYRAMYNCSPYAVEFALSRGATPDTSPPAGPYKEVRPLQFLASLKSCDSKVKIQNILQGKVYFNIPKPKEDPDWREKFK